MNVDLKYDYHEALKRCNFTQAQIDVLRESAKAYSIVPKSITNKQVNMPVIHIVSCDVSTSLFFQLLLFLNACDSDNKKATQMLVKHYEIRKKAPQLFTRRDANLAEIKQCFENQYYVNLPSTADEYFIAFHGLSNPVAKNYVYDTSTTCFLMMIRNYSPNNQRSFTEPIRFQTLSCTSRDQRMA